MMHIDTQWCKGCGLCVEVCPTDALSISQQRNHMGYRMPHGDETLCTGCKTCEIICPDLAISIENDKEQTHER